jgi:peptide/nickel transport system permease protein
LVLLGISVITFALMYIVPGDPARIMAGQRGDPETVARVRKEMGLDDPLHVQYGRFLWKVLHGDLGRSFKSNRRVAEALVERIPTTARLAVGAVLVAGLIGIPAGIVSALRHLTWIDTLTMGVALLGVCMPVFWLGVLLQVAFSLRLNLLPASGAGGWEHFVLPSLALGTGMASVLARLTRSSMLEVVRADYIRTARSKGLAERVVIYKHALKNALIPVVTTMGMQMGGLLSGAVLTETVFGLPGVGRFIVEGIRSRDFPVIQGSVLFVAVVFVITNLVVDILYAVLDPRIQYQ